MAFAPRTPGCYQHHLVWYDGEPAVKIGCAHCTYVSHHLDLTATYTDDETRYAINASRHSHARLCDRAGQARQKKASPRRR